MNSKGNMTAVEWMSENLKGHITEGILEEVTIQAKQMEKEQIKDAHSNGYTQTLQYLSSGVNFPDAVQYYNKTFKSE